MKESKKEENSEVVQKWDDSIDERVYTFEDPIDLFHVEGMERYQKRNDKTQLVEKGYGFLWANASNGNETEIERRKRELFEPVRDDDISCPSAERNGDGTPFFINRNNERYMLMKRPIKAYWDKFAEEQSAIEDGLKANNTIGRTENVTPEWRLKREGHVPPKYVKRGR